MRVGVGAKRGKNGQYFKNEWVPFFLVYYHLNTINQPKNLKFLHISGIAGPKFLAKSTKLQNLRSEFDHFYVSVLKVNFMLN